MSASQPKCEGTSKSSKSCEIQKDQGQTYFCSPCGKFQNREGMTPRSYKITVFDGWGLKHPSPVNCSKAQTNEALWITSLKFMIRPQQLNDILLQNLSLY